MLVGCDVGGTFTDFVVADPRGVRTAKRSSAPSAPGRLVVEGMRALGGTALAHGSTVATNAVLEGRGARTALVTTRGFEDVLAIGRQDRPDLYDLRITRPEPLVPSDRRFGLAERVAADGSVLRAPPKDALWQIAAAIRDSGAESVAVSLLFSFLHPEHERAVRDALPGLHVSLSSEVLPEFREYERTSTTVLDAFVRPIVHAYLTDLEASVGPFLVMRSSGGVLRSPAVRERPLEMLLSGPAGGVAAAKVVGDLSEMRNLVTFDMGGTSADVSVIADGEVAWTTETTLAGHPIALSMVDVASVGAGGGSVAWFDAGGALRVGPRSAGAEPGPMCYGRGGSEPTVSDSDLLGGALPSALLGGSMPLDATAARRGFERIAPKFGSLDAAIVAVQSVVRATMASAIRLALAKRGLDPREFALLAYGGAGALHAAYVARDLGFRRVLVPFLPGAFSAYGILVSDIRLDYGRTRVTPIDDAAPVIESYAGEFGARAREELDRQGVDAEPVLAPSVDLRYVGQSYEVNIPVAGDLAARFHERHEVLYGYAVRGEPIELVTVRLTATVPRSRVLPSHEPRGDALKGERSVAFPDGRATATVYDRAALAVGFEAEGPAVIEEAHATTVVPPGASVSVLAHGLLAVEVGE